MHGNDAQRSLESFSSLIDADYVAPIQSASPSEINFQSFLEAARYRIQTGSICTVIELDECLYYHVRVAVSNLNELLI